MNPAVNSGPNSPSSSVPISATTQRNPTPMVRTHRVTSLRLRSSRGRSLRWFSSATMGLKIGSNHWRTFLVSKAISTAIT